MDESLRSRIEQMARDRESGASELLGLTLGTLRDARGHGPLVLMEAARAVCRAQPSMASFWNAAAAALADVERPGIFERFAARAERSASALARVAVALLAPAEERDRPLHVTTCSFSSSVLACLEEVARSRTLSVACAEGRPALEGRRLASRLAAAGAEVELSTDAGVAAALSRTGALVVGADAVSSEWVLNKCGTSALAASCAARGIPVYVVASREKFLAPALAPLVRIAEHPAAEVWESAPPGVTVRNLYFEKVPLDWVTAIVTDAGVLGVDMVIEACQAQGTWVTPEIVTKLE
jgi:translation initiation factor 2B subunit (eIF-2B alpha/beta/delta family)